MRKIVKVTYNSESLHTEIVVDGQSFDTSRINGKEIADWAYPFMMRKVKWNGFYDEMVEALGGEKTFDLIFDGSEEALNELKEAWEDAPVNVISEENVGNNVVIEYDESTLNTTITVNGTPFDTSRINGKEIEDWVYPFMVRKVKWDGIFEELAKVIGSDEYTIQFSGSNSAMKALMEECPETIEVVRTKNKSVGKKAADNSNDDELQKAEELFIHSKTKEALPIFEKLAENGNGRAMYYLGEYYIQGNLGIKRNQEKGEFWRKKGADLGDVLAKLNTGYSYDKHSKERNIIMGSVFSEVKKLAESGDIIAQYELADLYMGGYPNEENLELGISWLERAGKNGYFRAQCKLGDYYYDEGAQRNISKALEWYTKASDQGNAEAKFMLGIIYNDGDEVDQDTNKALNLWKIAAEQGEVHAQTELGDCYYFGLDIEQNYKKAVEWYTKAAEQEFVYAWNKLGKCYCYGHGVEQNYEKAVEWYTKAAEQELVDAWYELGDCYYFGHGVEQNYEKAVELYTKAAEWYYTKAQYSLGICYYYGRGVEQNYEKAVEWYTEAAESNNISAMYDLAVCYYYGKGTSQNYQEAVRLFQLAANEGNVESLNFLGDCYYEGNGVTQSYSTAVSLYNEAMSNNSPQAYYNLGSCYRWGNGVPKDKSKAKELFKKGIELGSTNCSEAYEDMLKNDDKIKMAKKIGGEVLNGLGIQGGILGGLGMLGKACINSLIDDDDDDED